MINTFKNAIRTRQTLNWGITSGRRTDMDEKIANLYNEIVIRYFGYTNTIRMIPVFVSLFSSDIEHEVFWACRSMTQIALTATYCKAACIAAGAVPALAKLITSKSVSKKIATIATETLTNIIADYQAEDYNHVGQRESLCSLLTSKNSDEVKLAEDTLAIYDSGDLIRAYVEAGALPALVFVWKAHKRARKDTEDEYDGLDEDDNVEDVEETLNAIINHSKEFKHLALKAGLKLKYSVA